MAEIPDDDPHIVLARSVLGGDPAARDAYLYTMTPREEQLVRLLHAIGEPRAADPDEVAARFALTKTRVISIYRLALYRLGRRLMETMDWPPGSSPPPFTRSMPFLPSPRPH